MRTIVNMHKVDFTSVYVKKNKKLYKKLFNVEMFPY